MFELEAVVTQRHQNPASSVCFDQCLLEEEEDLDRHCLLEKKEEDLDRLNVSYKTWPFL
ncbi:hypothetical protein Tco_0549787, partial [Tanacetum coccineum]